MLYYQPTHQSACIDMWSIQKDGIWYTYHLQELRPGCTGKRLGYGMCVSEDLMDYTYRGEVIAPDASWESGALYAGDVLKWHGKYHMIYSGGRMTDGNDVDSMGYAASDDLENWEVYAGNPVMHAPDERWYEGNRPGCITHKINLRDPHFIRDACNEEYVYMCFAGATNDADNYRSGCIGLARSKNMIDWEYLPPLFAPEKYTLMEVPRVFRSGGKYILTWLSAPWYGMRSDADMEDRHQYWDEVSLHYAVADHPLGPYTMPEQPVLFRGMYVPYVINPVEHEGELMMMSTMFIWHGDAQGSYRTWGGLLPAMPIVYDGVLKVLFPQKLMKYYPNELPLEYNLPQYPYPQCELCDSVVELNDAALCALPLTGAENEVAAQMQVTLTAGRAGLLMRFDADKRLGYGVLFDHDRNEIEFVKIHPKFAKAMILQTQERHPAYAVNPEKIELRVIAATDRVLVFVDGVLRATYSFPEIGPGAFGVLTECAQGQVQPGKWYTR